MHIPKGASQTCALLTFDDALNCPQHDDYDAARWLYVPPYYTEYRYILGTRGENPLICIGINPSTAQPGDLHSAAQRPAARRGAVHHRPHGPALP